MSLADKLRAFLPRRPAPPPSASLIVDDTGVRRHLAAGREESVTWDALAAVEILTTSGGPFAEDVFFLLLGSDGRGCAVPQGAAMETDLLARLQALPGFDHMAVIAAMGCADDARFPCWRRAA